MHGMLCLVSGEVYFRHLKQWKSKNQKLQIWFIPLETWEILYVLPWTTWKNGVEIIDPSNIYDFYNYYHSYPVSCGVDGVKADVQNGQEMLGATTLIENFQVIKPDFSFA